MDDLLWNLVGGQVETAHHTVDNSWITSPFCAQVWRHPGKMPTLPSSPSLPGGGRRIRSTRRMVVIAVIVVLTVVLGAGLVGFFADPLSLPGPVLEVLDKRSSVISMFIAVIGLPISAAALLSQLRQDHAPAQRAEAATIPTTPLALSARGEAVNRSETPEQTAEGSPPRSSSTTSPLPSIPSAAASSRSSAEPVMPTASRSYGGDHIEVHHNTIHGPVTGKTVTPPPMQPDKTPDE
ncbi:hypothetical protein AB0F88_37060 [Streptosporangium sp. NPDC023963]|uniref:hypothetical protein n=1 Tax=Streptosporangium sp. NPDC023963 TaxID=3155608 RepID=UPI0034196068